MRAFERVVGIDQVSGGVAQQVLQARESLLFRGEGLNPGVRGGSEDRNAVAESCFRVAGSNASADVRSASREYAGFGRMRAARAEVDYRAAAGHFDDARCLGRDERLKSDGGQQECFDDLRFKQRRADRQDRFVGEDRRAFRHREKIAGEAKIAQCVEKSGRRRDETG